MRFFLDNDVDIHCADLLRSLGYDAWTARDAGRSDASDDEQTVYAMDHGAVLVTHDREFTERRKREPHGQHVRLTCPQIDGPTMLATNVDHLVSILPAAENLVVEVRVGKGGAGTITLFFGGGQQRADPPG